MASPSKEKYLLEIYLNVLQEGYARVSMVAKALNVSVSSTSKMAKKLAEENLIEFKRYGIITLTEKGLEIGEQLSSNHEVLVKFFQLINVDKQEIESEVSKVEFHISHEVIQKLEQFIR